MPDFSDVKRFPLNGKPGTPEYDAMSAPDKELVDRVYSNIGKSLEAYLRKLAAGRAPFDDFMLGYPTLKADAQRGMVAFTRHGCDACHAGPAFTDEGFHDLGYPTKPGLPKDPGRAGGMTLASKWPFSSTGRFADPARGNLTVSAPRIPDEPSGFRTPSLRNVELTAPYGHDGAFDTLDQVIDAHARVLPGGVAPDARDKQDLIQFLRALSGRPPLPPWNYWPGG
jgi:cytochrome c peroxidase